MSRPVHRSHRVSRGAVRRAHLRLEALEDRSVPSSVTLPAPAGAPAGARAVRRVAGGRVTQARAPGRSG